MFLSFGMVNLANYEKFLRAFPCQIGLYTKRRKKRRRALKVGFFKQFKYATLSLLKPQLCYLNCLSQRCCLKIIIKTSANSSVCLLSRWPESALSPLTSSLSAPTYACVKAVFTNFRSFFSFTKAKSTEINRLSLTEGISECIYLQLRRFLGNFHVNVLGPILFLIDIYDLSYTIQKTVVNILHQKPLDSRTRMTTRARFDVKFFRVFSKNRQ